MSSPTAPRRASRRHRLAPLLVAGSSGAILGVVLVLASIGPPTEHTLGPYVLNSSNPDISLSLPDCAIVTVHWNVVSGPGVNFSVGQGDVLLLSNCLDWVPPSNATCSVTYCGLQSTGPGPICFESGLSGACSFTATQPTYGFAAFAYPWDIGNVTVSFTIHCSVTEPVL